MPHFFSNRRFLLLLAGFILLVALIGLSLRDRGRATLPERAVKDSVGFVQGIFSKPSRLIMGGFGNVKELLNTYDENKTLKSRLQQHVSLEAKVSDLTVENKKLRALLGKREDLREFNPVQATVIARNPDQWEEKLILDKGTSSGVSRNMAVMTAEGLIGKVVLATSSTSTVELLSTQNPNLRVSALIDGSKEIFGLIEGYDAERGELLMKRIEATKGVKKGQKVLTSGLGGVFPKGIVIGEITDVSTDDYGLTSLAYIKPAAEFSLLDHVIIAKRALPMIDGSDGGRTDAGAAS